MIAPLLTTLAFLVSTTASAKPETLQVELADRVVKGVIDQPKGEGPHPFLILASGEVGEKRDPLFEKIFAAALAEGYVPLELEWSFKKSKVKPSADLKREAEELGTVVNDFMASRMMKRYELDLKRVVLLASGFAARVAVLPESGVSSSKVGAALLLNPSCDSAEDSFTKLYSMFFAAKAPRFLIQSKSAAGCPLPQIYAAAKGFGESTTLYTFEGEANAATLTPVVSNWLKQRRK